MAEEHDVFRHVVDVDDRYALELGFQLGELALDIAVLFLGEVILGVLRKVAQGGGLADPLLDVDLHLVKLLALDLEGRLFRCANHLHDVPLHRPSSTRYAPSAANTIDEPATVARENTNHRGSAAVVAQNAGIVNPPRHKVNRQSAVHAGCNVSDLTSAPVVTTRRQAPARSAWSRCPSLLRARLGSSLSAPRRHRCPAGRTGA